MTFQSHNGAIAARFTTHRLKQPVGFQSHNGAIAARHAIGHVSIPQWCDCCGSCSPFSQELQEVFQSHNGAIAARGIYDESSERRVVSIPQWCDCCLSAVRRKRLLLFQSHNGAIAACCSNVCYCSSLWFQSHNGAIAAVKALSQKKAQLACFNPTMVRLMRGTRT